MIKMMPVDIIEKILKKEFETPQDLIEEIERLKRLDNA
jgi:hypothetical protein